jgi:Zn-dependent M28 family amino/carboxypeptidase
MEVPAKCRDFHLWHRTVGVTRVLSCIALSFVSPDAAAAEPPPDVRPHAIRAHVEFLADDLLEGRATGSRGYAIAGRYVAAQMRLTGLQPAGAGGSWRQPVLMIESTRIVPAARVSIQHGATRIVLNPAADFIPMPSHVAAEMHIEAPLVFVGFGVAAPEYGYDDFAGVNLAGKLAVILTGTPPQIPGDRRGYYEKVKLHELTRRGAAGVVQFDTKTAAEPASWQQALAKARLGSLRLLDPHGVVTDTPTAGEAGIVLNAVAAAKLFSVGPKTLESVLADAEEGRLQSFEFPASISIDTRSTLRLLKSDNVVGMLEGANPQLRGEYVILMAHLDHIGQGFATEGDRTYNGALDNAGGVAVMLETARAIAEGRDRPQRSVLFLATTAEERGLLGSRYFALHPTVPREAIVAVVNVDMPVALYPAAAYAAIGAEHSTLGENAFSALMAEGLGMLPVLTPERGLFTLADQYSFVLEGIPALYLHDVPVSSDPAIDARRVFDDFLERHYHEVSDDLGLPINWDSLASFTRVQVRICRSIADDPRRPEWLPGDFYGRRYGMRKTRIADTGDTR